MSHLLGQFFVEKQKLTKVLFDTVSCNAELQPGPAKHKDLSYTDIVIYWYCTRLHRTSLGLAPLSTWKIVRKIYFYSRKIGSRLGFLNIQLNRVWLDCVGQAGTVSGLAPHKEGISLMSPACQSVFQETWRPAAYHHYHPTALLTNISLLAYLLAH